MEREVNSMPYNIKEVFKAAIRKALTNKDKNAIVKVCSRFRCCLEKVVAADGVHIEGFVTYLFLAAFLLSIIFLWICL